MQSAVRKEKGIAMVEFAISLPLLLILFIVTVESGRLLHQYMLLSNIAATAVRSGIQLAGIGEQCFESEDEAEGTRTVFNLGYQSAQPSSSGLGPHWFAQRRAHVLLFHSKASILVAGTRGVGEPDMASEFIRDTESNGSISANCLTTENAQDQEYRLALRNSFAIRLEGSYSPLLIPFDIPLKVESRASYLLQNSNFPLAGGPPCRPRIIY